MLGTASDLWCKDYCVSKALNNSNSTEKGQDYEVANMV